MTTPIWTPSPERAARSAMSAFARAVAAFVPAAPGDYDALHAWSVRDVSHFWRSYARWSRVLPEPPSAPALSAPTMWSARWFAGTRLSYARALLEPAAAGGAVGDDDEAVVAVDESGWRSALSWAELRGTVAMAQAALRREGVIQGDRVAVMAGNGSEALVLLLACAGIGAIFTSCSPDFGFEASSARFAQVAPRVLLASPSSRYGGRRTDIRATVLRLARSIPSVTRLVWLPVRDDDGPEGGEGRAWRSWLSSGGTTGPEYLELPFDHPLYVLYSSGTTGAPKAIVHRAGGALLTHHKEHRLHCDIRAGDRVLYFTTLGWMMWNWLASALAQRATVVLYDGSPVWPDPLVLWRLAERERLTFFGTSARYLHGLQAAGARPGAHFDLTPLRTVTSTGSPLSPAGFRFVYEHIADDVHLASISGGTDIVGCFMLGVPTLPVYEGQIQRPGLGVDLAVYSDDGSELHEGAGELVCRSPLPSMPLGFWGDEDGSRFERAYFERFPGVWHHGDLIERTREGGIIVHGRSDATLNPGGVRIGTVEIYRPLEARPEVLEACAVPRRRAGDEEIWLLVVLRDGIELDEGLAASIKGTIRAGASPRHVPRVVLQVGELPRTRSGKAMELAVRRIVNGEEVGNMEVIANPEVCPQIAAAVARASEPDR